MKYLVLIFILITTPLLAQKKLEINCINTGENLFIQNPFTDDLIHFCTEAIKINDSIYSTDLNRNAIKLDLRSFKIPLGEKVNIIIIHKERCIPKILHSMGHPPRISKIRFDSIKLDEEGVLTWTCFNDRIRRIVDNYLLDRVFFD